MTDATTQSAAAKAEGESKTVLEIVTERRVFQDLAAAGVALGAIAEQASDFGSTVIVAPGASFEDGEFVPEAPEWTAESHEIMLAPLATKAQTDGKGTVTKPARLIALVFTPIPSLEGLLDDERGEEMVREVIRKELNHRAVRKLRTAENVLAMASEMPLSIESFAVSQSGGGVAGLVAFDDHWLLYSSTLAKHPAVGAVWGSRFPGGKGKAAIRGAIENAARARALFPELEAFGPEGKEESLFVRLLQAIIKKAESQGQDTSLLRAWLDTRDQQTYEAGEELPGDVNLDSLFDDMGSTDADEDEDGDPPSASDETGEAESVE